MAKDIKERVGHKSADDDLCDRFVFADELADVADGLDEFEEDIINADGSRITQADIVFVALMRILEKLESSEQQDLADKLALIIQEYNEVSTNISGMSRMRRHSRRSNN